MKSGPITFAFLAVALLLGINLVTSAPAPNALLAKSAALPAPSFTNRLAQEKSPYLLQHAHNPVDWYPWGEEAFAKARAENKPIFLSIGYSTCHWCHVMAHESFEDPAIAKIMNDRFVCIKVDREERPDVDRVYMAFVQATTGSGGWPMSVWLTPELKPFFGGTYFPNTAKSGLSSFPTLLEKIADSWKNNRDKIVAKGNELITALQSQLGHTSSETNAVERSLLESGFTEIAGHFDDQEGGFGRQPKFPRPVTLNFLFRVVAREGKASKSGKQALEMNLFTLKKMAAGGVHDHLGGGFHRYSVDRFWHVPHFEKMLYDQAQLASAYLDAFQITRNPLNEQVARDILDYVRRDLTDKQGGFYSAEDADSLFEQGKPEHGEGVFYVWKKEEIVAALGKKSADIFGYHYGVEAKGNAPDGSDPHQEFAGKNILIQRHTQAETAKEFKLTEAEAGKNLDESRLKLFTLRANRPRPHLDDKIITAWNGLMISAFARAHQVLAEPAYLEAALRAAAFVRDQLVRKDSGELIRSYRQGASAVKGFADDYAFLIQGLLDLYEASFDIQWFRWALQLQEKQDSLFWDAQSSGYFSTSGNDSKILLRMKEDYDGAEPSPNSVAALNLLRLAAMTGQEPLRQRAEKVLSAFSSRVKESPASLPQMLVALDFYLAKPKQIVLAGKPDAADTRAMLREVHRHFLPNKILLLAEGGEGQAFLAVNLEFIKNVRPINGRATAYVCENFVCKLPVSDLAGLNKLLTVKPELRN